MSKSHPGIIIKPGQSKERYGIVRTISQSARNRVSRENRQEYDNEKRAKEISAKMRDSNPEYNAVAVAKMMDIPESVARNLIIKKSKGMVLDGKID